MSAPDIRMIPANGATLVVQTEGAGDPVVLLHGFADDRRSWDGIAAALARDHLVVRYDLRGFGESSEPGQVRFRHAHDLRLVLDTLGITRCDLVGVSMGGAIALNFALDLPERVRRLCLISPALVGWQWSDGWRSRWLQIREVAAKQGMAQARELWWNHPVFSVTRSHSAAAAMLQRAISQYSGNHWLRDNEERALPDVDRLTLLCMPTLLITGSGDVEDFRVIGNLIEAASPQVSRLDIEAAGHLPHLEFPSAVTGRVSGFLHSPLPG